MYNKDLEKFLDKVNNELQALYIQKEIISDRIESLQSLIKEITWSE